MAVQINIKKQLGKFNLDLTLSSQAKRIGILGPSGCGKTLTLKCIAGIEKPDQGSIMVDGRILFDGGARIDPKPQQRKVGYMFQNYALFPNMTVRENIGAGIRKNSDHREEKIDQLISRFYLEGLDQSNPVKLSGGQQQRVALARIIASEPEIILMDEPFSALDAYLKEQIQHEFFGMLADYQGTVIMVSHNRDEIYRFSEDLLIMENGRDICQGDCKAIFKTPGRIQAARLTGCENILPVMRIDDHHLKLVGFEETLSFSGKIPENISAIGIRAKDWMFEEMKNQALSPMPSVKLSAEITDIEEMPYEWRYYLKSGRTEGQMIYCHEPKSPSTHVKMTGQNVVLSVPEEKILWLY